MRSTNIGVPTIVVLALAAGGCRFAVDRTLNPGELRGRLELQSASGALSPATDAHVQIVGSRDDVSTDSNGEFVFVGLSGGTFSLRVLRPLSGTALTTVLVLQNLVIPQSSGTPNALDLGTVIIAALGGVQGTVTLGGVAQPAARVVVSGIDQQIASGTGTFYFASLPPGPYQLFVVDTQGKLYEGAAAQGVPVTVKSRAVATVPIELNQLVPAAGGTVTGQVQTSGSSVTGATAANAAITFSGSGSPITFMTDATGSYSGSAPAGVYSVVGHKAGFADGVIPDFVVDGNASVPEIVLVPLGTGNVPANPCAPVAAGEPPGPCDANATCVVQGGAAVCSCQPGYTGDGYSCATTYSGMATCGAGNGCNSNATCAIVSGQQTCTCNFGYTGNGTTCTGVMNGTSLTITGDAASAFGTQTVTFAACATNASQGNSVSFPLSWPAADAFQPFHSVSVYVFDDSATIQDLYGDRYYSSGTLALTLSTASGALTSTSMMGGTTSNPATGNEVTVPGNLTVSGTYKCTPATAPTAPSNVVASIVSGQVRVTWTPPSTDGGALLSGYTVTASPGGHQTSASTYPECDIVGLTPGQSYTFTVVATNTVGTGPASAPSAALAIPSAAVPGAPLAVTATNAGPGAATIAWVPNSNDGGSPVTGYTVTATPGGQTATVAQNELNATVMGLTNGTSYTFTVVATNGVGTSAPSAASAPLTVLGPPDAPTGVAAVPGNGQVTLSWTAPANDGGSPIAMYGVTQVGVGFLNNYHASPATITNLPNGTAVSFTVQAINLYGGGPQSVASILVTPQVPPAVPGAPTNVVAVAGNGIVTLTWTPPASNGSPILTYGGAAVTGPDLTWSTGDNAIAAITVQNGTPFSSTVYAVNAVGEGPSSVVSNTVTPYDPPSSTYSSVASTPLTVTADGHSTATLLVTLEDASQVVLPGVTVILSVNGTANQIFPVSGVTNTSGQFTATLTSTHPENKTVQVSAYGQPVQNTTVSFTSVACAGTSLLSRSIADAAGPFVPLAMAFGDVNGDRTLDLMVSDNANQVMVQLGNGDGTYQAGVSYAVGTSPVSLVVADFNGDNHLDFATLNLDDSTVSVLLGNGDGTFQTQLVTTGIMARTFQTEDFNVDRKADLILEMSDASLGVLLGNGDGSFQTLLPTVDNEGAVGPMVTNYFDGSMYPGLVVSGSSGFAYFKGLGDGAFEPETDFSLPNQPSGLATADINLDGYADLAFNVNGTVEIFLGQGSGGFQALTPSTLTGWTSTGGIVVETLGGSGFPDVVAGLNDAVDVFVGNGTGALQMPVQYQNGNLTTFMTAGDFNTDGYPDIATMTASPGTNVDVLLNVGDGTFAVNPILPAGPGPWGVATADFNGDGVADLAVADLGQTNTGNTVSVILSMAGGGFSPAVTYTVGSGAEFLTIGDFNNDGVLDLAVLNSADQTVTILPGAGDGSFTPPGPAFAIGSGPQAIAAADFNGDGNLDVAIARDSYVSVFLGNGQGAFGASMDTSAGPFPNALAVADFNNDGHPDIAAAGESGSGYILVGVGDGTFTASPFAGGLGTSITTADFNGDGNADLAVIALGSSNNLNVTLGNGDGTFGTPTTYSVNGDSGGNAWITSGDVNGDGQIDLIVQGDTPWVSVLVGTGAGLFQGSTASAFVTAAADSFVTLGDFNGDGRLDAVSIDTAQSVSSAEILLNSCEIPCHCSPNATCDTSTGVAVCTCDAGFVGNGTECSLE